MVLTTSIVDTKAGIPRHISISLCHVRREAYINKDKTATNVSNRRSRAENEQHESGWVTYYYLVAIKRRLKGIMGGWVGCVVLSLF